MRTKILCALLGAILIGCTSFGEKTPEHNIDKITDATNPAQRKERGSVLTIGVISYGEGIESLDRYEPLKDYLATQSNAIVELEPAYNELKALEQIQRQNWSLIFVPPGLGAIAIKKELYTPLFPSEEGVNRLEKSVIVVLENSSIQQLKDLAHQTIALGKQGSATGYYIPLYDLYGLTFKEIKLAPTPKQILQWLQEGKVVAGALSKQEFEFYKQEFSVKFRILEESRTVPPGLVMIASNISKDRQNKIREIMMNAPVNIINNAGYAPNLPVPNYRQFIILVTKVKPLEKKIRQTPVTLTIE